MGGASSNGLYCYIYIYIGAVLLMQLTILSIPIACGELRDTCPPGNARFYWSARGDVLARPGRCLVICRRLRIRQTRGGCSKCRCDTRGLNPCSIIRGQMCRGMDSKSIDLRLRSSFPIPHFLLFLADMTNTIRVFGFFLLGSNCNRFD